MSMSVHVRLADRAFDRALAAGFEEEGVPVVIERGNGDALALARAAARASVLGLGVGADSERIVLVLAAAPARPYLEADATVTRAFGQAVARIAARRPLSMGPLMTCTLPGFARKRDRGSRPAEPSALPLTPPSRRGDRPAG